MYRYTLFNLHTAMHSSTIGLPCLIVQEDHSPMNCIRLVQESRSILLQTHFAAEIVVALHCGGMISEQSHSGGKSKRLMPSKVTRGALS